MRLCFLCDADNIHSRRWIEPIIQYGHEVHIVSYTNSRYDYEGAAGQIDLTELYNYPRIRLFIWSIWLRRYLRKEHIDVLHSQSLPFAGWLAVMTGFRPLLVTGWGSDLLVFPYRSPKGNLLYRKALQYVDALTVPSDLMYESARNLRVPPERIHLIHWGVEQDVFRNDARDAVDVRSSLGFDAKSRLILSPRAIAPRYNIDIVIKAFREVIDYHKDAFLLILLYNVENECLKQLQDIIQRLDISDRIVWLEPRKRIEEMAALYHAVDTVISIPSSEGYGFTIYEAMASGIPTVISDLPVYSSEIVDGKHALKVPVRDVSKTSISLKRILYDRNLAKLLADEARLLVDQHSVGARLKKVINLYNSFDKSSIPST